MGILSIKIISDIHKTCLDFLKNKVYGLASQMNKSAVSLPSNIAEGSTMGNKHF